MLNGGSGIPTTMTVPSGTLVGTALMPLPTPQRTGYTFMGWFDFAQVGMLSLDEDMLGEGLYYNDFNLGYMYEYESGNFEAYSIEPLSVAVGSFTVTGNRTLHAHWFRRFEVTLISPVGDLTTQRLYFIPGAAIGNIPGPVRPGFTFHGWSTEPNSNTMIEPTMRVNRDMRLYARWMVRIVFDASGGYLPDTIWYRVSGSTVTLPTPRRQGASTGRRFVGWHHTFGSGGEVANNFVVPNVNTAVSARWVDNTVSYRHHGSWWPYNDVPLGRLLIDDTLLDDFGIWYAATRAGINNWNQSSAPVRFVDTPSSRHTVTVRPIVGSIFFG